MNNLLKNIGIWLVIGLVVLTVVKQFDARQTTKDTIPYSEFIDSAKNGKVESAVIEGRTIKCTAAADLHFDLTVVERHPVHPGGDDWCGQRRRAPRTRACP